MQLEHILFLFFSLPFHALVHIYISCSTFKADLYNTTDTAVAMGKTEGTGH